MRCRSGVLAVVFSVVAAAGLVAQGSPWSFDVGYSFQGGHQSRVAVRSGATGLTGADGGGLHLRGGYAIQPEDGRFGLRFEGFYNRLTSDRRIVAVVGGLTLPTAESDQTVGMNLLFVARASRTGEGGPYLLFGGGPMYSRLRQGTTEESPGGFTHQGLGLGVSMGPGSPTASSDSSSGTNCATCRV